MQFMFSLVTHERLNSMRTNHHSDVCTAVEERNYMTSYFEPTLDDDCIH